MAVTSSINFLSQKKFLFFLSDDFFNTSNEEVEPAEKNKDRHPELMMKGNREMAPFIHICGQFSVFWPLIFRIDFYFLLPSLMQ